jgi:hypothetical protein
MGLKDERVQYKYYYTNDTYETMRPIFTIFINKCCQDIHDSNVVDDVPDIHITHKMTVVYTFQMCHVDIIERKSSNGRKNHYFICGSCHTPVKSLFKPTFIDTPLCRKCHKLTYNSVQMHDGRLDNRNIKNTFIRLAMYKNGTPFQSIKPALFIRRLQTNEYIKRKFKTCYKLERVL